MTIDRRQFVRLACAAAAAPALQTTAGAFAPSRPRARFRLGLGTYTFRNQDLDGLIERCRDLNLRTIELSHPQYMLPQAKIENCTAARQKLQSGDIELRSWYCGDLTKKEEIDRLVEGVRLFGVKTVSGSARRELLDAIDAACGKEGFKFGIHNHYFANRKFIFESPEDVLSALQGRANLFSTLDTGHMIAVGVDPTEAWHKLKAHVRIIHLKDEDKPGHGVIMGQGKGDMSKFLRTIASEGFNGLAAIEYEEGTDPKQEVAECVRYIREHVALEGPAAKMFGKA